MSDMAKDEENQAGIVRDLSEKVEKLEKETREREM